MKWILGLILFFTLSTTPAHAVECVGSLPSSPSDLDEYIKKCEQVVSGLRSQAATLKQAITVLDSKIKLTQAQVEKTTRDITRLESEISTLSVVVTDIDQSLDKLVSVFVARVRQSYKRRDPDVLGLFLASENFGQFFTKIRYLNIVKAKDQLVLNEMQNAKISYQTQKETKIIKQKEVALLKDRLVIQQKDLGSQQASKKELLTITANDEKKYQSLISQARAELEAIDAIIRGSGKETQIGDVNSGDSIAKIIQGASCNSSGAHLHFIVSKSGSVQNPFNYLKSIDHENCSGSSCGSGNGDPFNPSGSWDWPISAKVIFSQGYGSTWGVRNTWVGNIYSFHNGIDINTQTSDSVRAVQSGTLYRGAYTGSNGCALKYVRVDHKDSDLETFYLHINYL